MYTNTIIGSYNTIANSEHGAFIMKPPIRRQPKKSHSKEGHGPHRGNSEESAAGGGVHASGANSVNSVLSPSSLTSPSSGAGPPSLPGLEILGNVSSVLVHPDKIFSPEVSKICFTVCEDLPPPVVADVAVPTIDTRKVTPEPRPLLQCVPGEGSNSRSLLLQTADGRSCLQLRTHTPYCCSWYQNLEAKISLPNGDPFGCIAKTAYGPFKCNRRFSMSCRRDGGTGDDNEKLQFEVEVLFTPTELLIKENSQIVAKVSSPGIDFRKPYKVTFMKSEPELSPNVKTLFILFAILLHIAFAEKLNTCFGMGLCCFAGSFIVGWIMCIL